MNPVIKDCIFLVDSKPEYVFVVDKDSQSFRFSDILVYSELSASPTLSKLRILFAVAKFLFKKKPR